MKESPVEVWVIEPDQEYEGFQHALSYFLHAGVNFAFGEGDSLPREMPQSLDGIKVVFVLEEDVPRLRQQLLGFRGISPDSDHIYLSPSTSGSTDHARMALHENDQTWLVVFKADSVKKTPQRLEYCLIAATGIAAPSTAFRKRLADRDDQALYPMTIGRILKSKQLKRTDALATGRYYLAKTLLEATIITGDENYALAFEEHSRAMIDRVQEHEPGFLPIGAVNYMWMYQRTGEQRFKETLLEYADKPRREIFFKPGAARWCHAYENMTAQTRQVIDQRDGMMGTYGEQMGVPLAMMRVARFLDREQEYASTTAAFVKSMHKNLKDPETGLFAHGTVARGLPGTMGHGLGWSSVGLAQILDLFPKDHREYNDLVEIYQSFCEAAVSVQGPEGTFHSILNWHWTPVNEHYTSWLTYALLHGIRKGYLDESFREPAMKAWRGMKGRLFRGAFAMACGASGVANRMDFYVGRTFGHRDNPFLEDLAYIQQLLAFHEIMFLANPDLDDSLPG